MATYLVFDTETTGKIPNHIKTIYSNNIKDIPRLTQIAWTLYSDSGEVINKRCELIKPNGWEMPTGDFHRDHGFSQEKSMKFGIPIEYILPDFADKILKADKLVAHNMFFDEMIMAAEFIRLNAVVGKRIDKICTMQLSTEYCQVPSPYKRGAYKWPTLMELHTHLFKVGFEGAHDAMVDVEACGRSLFELMKRGIITE
jgi:DNA polymerase-3 subunit epsilon